MRFKSFEIKNFRGISKAALNLAHRQSGNVNVLVGLNESGKTTVLEALYNFQSNPNLRRLDPSNVARTPKDYQAMLPIGKRALFNDAVEISATFEIESEDRVLIDAFLKKEFGFVESWYPDEFEISHSISFKDSSYSETNNNWSLTFFGQKSRRENAKDYWLEGDDWLKAALHVKTLLPKIVYFPSTVLDFPDRIILDTSSAKQGGDKNSFYCEVIGDILRAIDSGLDITTHLISRAKSSRQHDKENLNALLLRVEQHLKKTVFAEWETIFGQSLDGKDFRIHHGFDDRKRFYLEIRIQENAESFAINERSAGFRWFFAFILLTKYRVSRNDRVLFLFDEPANNLHPNAQAQLVRSLKLLSEQADIVYSTHSHYLINPLWLESTHVVRNAAIDETLGMSLDATVRTAIDVIPYKTFVGKHPEQYFYYLPVMEALDYSPSPLEFPSHVVLVEGKTDFFLLNYFGDLLECNTEAIHLFPGGGAGSLDPLVTLLSGWGRHFIILVDSDAEGEKQKRRYIEKFESIVEGRVFSLGDVDASLMGKSIESILTSEDKEQIRQTVFPELAALKKKQTHVAIQELLAKRCKLPFAAETISRSRKIFEFAGHALSEND